MDAAPTPVTPRLQVRVDRLPPPEWEVLAADGPLLATPKCLRAVANRLPAPAHYFFVDRDGEPYAGLLGQLAVTPATDDTFNLYDILVGEPRTMPLTDEAIEARAKLRDEAPAREEWFPNLILALPTGESMPVGAGADDEAALSSLVRGIVDWARDQGLTAVCLPYLRRQYRGLDQALTSLGATKFTISATADLHLPGDSFDDYLAMLPREHRRAVRRDQRVVEQAGIGLHRRSLADHLEEVLTLRVKLKEKYGRTPNPEKERTSLLGVLEEFTDDELALFTAEVDGEMLGFALDMVHGGIWYGILSGTQYDDPRSNRVSLVLDYYLPIQAAYEAGIHEFRFGMASWDTKRWRGCHMVPLDAYVVPLRPELEPAIAAAVAATTVNYADPA